MPEGFSTEDSLPFLYPYTICWTTLEREDTHITLQDTFKSLGLQKIEDEKKKKQFKKKQKQSPDKCSTEVDTSEDLKEKEPEDNEQGSGWTPVLVRRQLAIGVNEVTRALERNGLLLVLVCNSAKPAIITSHLIQLSSSRSVPACQVPRLSETLAPVIGLKCVLALGFRKDTMAFVEVKAIIPQVPSLHIPWLHGQPEEAWENIDTESPESQDKEILETSFENLSKHKVCGRSAGCSVTTPENKVIKPQ